MTEFTDMDAAAIACAAIRRYAAHPDYEDLKQEAMLRAIQESRRKLPISRRLASHAAHVGARRAVSEYLYPHRSEVNGKLVRCNLDLRPVSLDALCQAGNEAEGDPVIDLLTDDFDWERVTDRLTLLQVARQHCTPCEREVLELFLHEGLSQADIGRRLGLKPTAVAARFKTAYRRIRAALPEEWD